MVGVRMMMTNRTGRLTCGRKSNQRLCHKNVKAHLNSVGKSDGLSHPDKGNNWSINVVDGSDQGNAALSAFLQTSKDVMVALPMVSLLLHKGVRPPQPLAKGTLGVASLEVVSTVHIHLKKCHEYIMFEENMFDG